ILLLIVAHANICLLLTNACVGDFMMFAEIFSAHVTSYNIAFTVLQATSIILGAVYTLTMVQKVFFGTPGALTGKTVDISTNERWALGIIVALILVFGVYPQPMLHLTDGYVTNLLKQIDISHLSLK